MWFWEFLWFFRKCVRFVGWDQAEKPRREYFIFTYTHLFRYNTNTKFRFNFTPIDFDGEGRRGVYGVCLMSFAIGEKKLEKMKKIVCIALMRLKRDFWVSKKNRRFRCDDTQAAATATEPHQHQRRQNTFIYNRMPAIPSNGHAYMEPFNLTLIPSRPRLARMRLMIKKIFYGCFKQVLSLNCVRWDINRYAQRATFWRGENRNSIFQTKKLLLETFFHFIFVSISFGVWVMRFNMQNTTQNFN